MGNTYLEPETKRNLHEYAEENRHKSPSRAVDGLLAEHRELLATKRENELLHRIFKPYELDEEAEIL